MTLANLYSSHIFMFPFRFDWNEEGFENEFAFYQKQPIDKRVAFNLKKFQEHLSKEWEYKSFNLTDRPDLYNEYAYFYDYARDAIYNQNESEDSISYFFEKDKKELINATYTISVKDKKSYELNITGLSLRVFHSGVAILAIELENHDYENFNDILRINDYGRRIYPQFIAEGSTIATKSAFLADHITIKTSKINITESFDFKAHKDIVIGKHIMQLLGTPFSDNKYDVQTYYIQPILDDRMFVISWYGNSAMSNWLSQEYETSDDWYKYIFADNDTVNVKNSKMKKELIAQSTYDRWSKNHTLYGISRYSFVCFSSQEWFPVNIIRPHMHTMYFQMVTLLLATRASILRFSDEIAAVAGTKNSDRLESLYERYLTFYNRLYFKEVTHQDQGIELYDIARKQMRIDEHIEKLDNKFTKLFEFADLQATKREEANKEKLQQMFNLISGIFIFPSLMIALLSMSIYNYDQSFTSLMIGLAAIIGSGFLGYFAFKSLTLTGKDDEKST